VVGWGLIFFFLREGWGLIYIARDATRRHATASLSLDSHLLAPGVRVPERSDSKLDPDLRRLLSPGLGFSPPPREVRRWLPAARQLARPLPDLTSLRSRRCSQVSPSSTPPGVRVWDLGDFVAVVGGPPPSWSPSQGGLRPDRPRNGRLPLGRWTSLPSLLVPLGCVMFLLRLGLCRSIRIGPPPRSWPARSGVFGPDGG
jgi:hypothetical protein